MRTLALCCAALAAVAPEAQAAEPATTTYGAQAVRFDVQLGPQATPPPGPAPGEPLVRRGIYDRPYLLRLGSAGTDVALGGYFDLVGSYLQRQGVPAGFTAEARRFNLFITSRIADRIRLTSEIEFERGAAEIALETAAIDIMLHHALNLRGGVLLVPIGKFNIAHDSPLYDVADRPLVSTRILGATLSDVGGGLFGALYPGGHKLTYEVYVVNGLSDGLLAAAGTRVAEGKSPARFAADNNGVPAVTARLGYATPPRRSFRLETAVSFYSGIYNTYQREGLQLDQQRFLHLLAYDLETSAGPITVRGELAYAQVDVPPALTALHGAQQLGLYLEGVGAVLRRPLPLFPLATLLAVARVDHVDLNMNLGQGDEVTRLTLGLSLRPVPGTTLRVGYYHEWLRDPLNNDTRGGGFQLSIASYF